MKKAGEEYLHFTLYKENKDTMDAVNHIARMLKIKSSNFGFAGTKDRRASYHATRERSRPIPQQPHWLIQRLTTSRLGISASTRRQFNSASMAANEFGHCPQNTELTRGGEYSLQHRLLMTEECVQFAVDHVVKHGFINYFGLQRFGTHAIGTQEIGLKILNGDFEGAIESILTLTRRWARTLFGTRKIKSSNRASNRDEIDPREGDCCVEDNWRPSLRP